MKSRCDGMARDGNVPLNGKQIGQLADGLLAAFTGFNDLAKVVRVALDEPLNRIVDQQANFEDQVWQLVEWTTARGKVHHFFQAVVHKVPGNDQLREAVGAVFGEVALGDGPEVHLQVRDVVEAKIVETHKHVLDLKEQIQRLLDGAHMHAGPVRPSDSFSIREEERPAVKALLARFRQLPAEEQQRLPDLLNGLGKLQVGYGDFEGARQAFTEAARCTPEATAQAEAQYNAYWAALEQQKWDEALDAIRKAASLDPERFTPFPLQRYEPRRILGAGGFGTAFLCRDMHFDEDVVVKTLHTAELARSTEEVFREARVLSRLSDPAVIGVRDCDYADPAAKLRPYIVMDYFPGQSLAAHVRQHGPLSPDDLMAVARQVACGLQAAHRRGIYHRDLKPDNVLVHNEGGAWSVKIIDFGLAMWRQTTATGSPEGSHEKSMLTTSVAGTVSYAPPEQLGRLPGVAVGPYSDVYSFGKTCCYALFAVTQPNSQQWGTVPEPLAEWLGECVSEEWQKRSRDFETVLNRLDQLPGRMGVDLAVPGRWLTRPVNEPQAEWEFLGETPRRVTLLFGRVYRFEVASGVKDAELESLARLGDLTALQHLSLWGCEQVTDAGLTHLRGLTALQYLDLRGCGRVKDTGLANLRGLTALQYLCLRGCGRVTDVGLALLRGLSALQYLDLEGCTRVTDVSLAFLRDLSALQHLDLGGCEQVTDDGLASLRELTALQYLGLRECSQVTDSGLLHMRGLTALRHLDLGGCEKVTDAGLAHLRGLTSLRHLSLWGCRRVTAAGLASLGGLTALENLDLRGGEQLTDASLVLLQSLTALQYLDLGGCEQVTDAGLSHLRGLSALQYLGMCLCKHVTDAGLAHLRGMTALQYLDLGGCEQVTDAGLAHLRGLTGLQRLSLWKCEQVTDAGLKALQNALPECRIATIAF
jgi:tetratricopeptide (TPR) repeat protein